MSRWLHSKTTSIDFERVSLKKMMSHSRCSNSAKRVFNFELVFKRAFFERIVENCMGIIIEIYRIWILSMHVIFIWVSSRTELCLKNSIVFPILFFLQKGSWEREQFLKDCFLFVLYLKIVLLKLYSMLDFK